MKRIFALFLLSMIYFHVKVEAQIADTVTSKAVWEGEAALSLYFKKEDFFAVPVVSADKGWLHLEARYNYESEETFSIWGGYNVKGGKKFEYAFTPMIGFVAGEIVGVAPGLEMTLTFHSFDLYSESEYFIAPQNSEENFMYTWTDLSWSPKEWLWIGISGQRTRLFESEFELQHGLFLGGGFKKWELTGYLYNPGSNDTYIIATVSWSF